MAVSRARTYFAIVESTSIEIVPSDDVNKGLKVFARRKDSPVVIIEERRHLISGCVEHSNSKNQRRYSAEPSPPYSGNLPRS
jgi:hypothetical protein